MALRLTEPQKAAVEAKGNILVSAAAGSGKTAVLVERVINKLTSKTDFVSADRLLIVTFTNAATAEMRSRIEKRLDELIELDPYNTALLTQKHLLPNAKICTIDSFCIDLVRENFERAGVSPDFKIGDNSTLASVNERVILSIFNRYLKENNEAFLKLLDIIGTEYSEKNFIDFVLNIFNSSRQLPYPKKWFSALADSYSFDDFSKSIWSNYCFSVCKETLQNLINNLKNAVELLDVSADALNIFKPSFDELNKILSKILLLAEKSDWDGVYTALNGFSLPAISAVRKYNDIPQVMASKGIFKNTITQIDRLKSLFFAEKSFISTQFAKLYEPVKLLSNILIEFDDSLFEEYKHLNTFTFHNTEHLALKLLCQDTPEGIIINPDAKELLERFDEVMVDEYQDTNDLQDLLFKVLSNNEKKLFVVGDVKQSIYGFRGANPNNFLSKKQRYIPIEQTSSDNPQKIVLGENFRSKPQVCSFINYFFEQFMSKATGEIVYDKEEKLVPSAIFPENETVATEFALIDTTATKLNGIEQEAKYIAEYIKKVMAAGKVIKQDDDTLREAKFSDFAILIRSANLKAPTMAKVLKSLGIPVNFSAKTFAECSEISIFLSLLTIIDNPLNDVEMLTVLMSPLFNFSPDELAQIRKDTKKDYLYLSLLSNENLKVKHFLNKLSYYRSLSVVTPLPRFILMLLNETNFLDIASNLPQGPRRKANLLSLCSIAEDISNDGYDSISDFITKIRKNAENIPSEAKIGENSVKIMSIHASKGLQFPVCIVADLDASFSTDSKKNAIYDVNSAIGFRYYDEVLKTKLTTVSREVILDNATQISKQEELRLLYVAMTRTKDKLLLVSAINKPYEKIEFLKNLYFSNEGSVSKYVFTNMKSYADWIIYSLLPHPDAKAIRGIDSIIIPSNTDSKILVKIIGADSLLKETVEKEKTYANANKEFAYKICENISYRYPFEQLLDIEAKASVSKLANSAENLKFAFSARPEFMENDGITPAGRGTAMHKVMQFFNFEKANDLDSELERLYEWKFISEAEYNSINKEHLKRFFESDLFNRIKKAKFIKKEMRFLTEVSAKIVKINLDDNLKNEKIVVQGAVDICFSEDDGLVILDFKTDNVTNPNALIEAYAEQLNIYAIACEKIFEMPVKQKIIYSFSLGKEITI